MAYKGKLGLKAQDFVSNIVNKFFHRKSAELPNKAPLLLPESSSGSLANSIELPNKVKEPQELIHQANEAVTVSSPIIKESAILNGSTPKESPDLKVELTVLEEINKKPESEPLKTEIKIGTYEDPVVEETQDIALLGNKKKHVQMRSRDENDSIHLNNFMMDVDSSGAIPYQGYDGVIMDTYEDMCMQRVLREMQYNGGIVPDKEVTRLKHLYHKDNLWGMEARSECATEEEFVQKSIKRIQDCAILQKESLKELEPSIADCILYRGVKLGYSSINIGHRNDFSSLLKNLKEGDKTVLDWGVMCTSGNISIASQYGDNILRILTPKGSRLPCAGEEIRFPSKSEFIFKGKNNYNGLVFWDFEYVIPKLNT